jgi:hypothetical protein
MAGDGLGIDRNMTSPLLGRRDARVRVGVLQPVGLRVNVCV